MTTRENLIEYWKRSGTVKDAKVLGAFAAIDRRLFVPQHLRHEAYMDIPLPLVSGQTISQPTTVAIMTQALRLKLGMKVLEIGAGSGYQAAIIAHIVGKKGKVISIEFLPELVEMAKRNLKRAGIKNVEVIEGDGGLGYPKEAPYDRIIMTCAAQDFPPPLIEQLKDGGIILGPLGGSWHQELVRGTKRGNKLARENLGGFVFVPLRGRYGV